jgi:endonuclease YncB( thermonuclease family)
MLFFLLSLVFAESYTAPRRGTVVAVYDGDTFTLNTGDKIRLLGVNTPELKPREDYGIEARDAATSLLLNKRVTLSYGDVKKDGYGRLLASVKQGEVDTAVYLLEKGLGHVFLIPPDSLDKDALLDAQKKAREANKGLWRTEPYQASLHITSFHPNSPGDDSENLNGEYLRVCNISQESINIKGYYITDAQKHTFVFPDVVIPAGHTFKIRSGSGTHQKDSSKQLEVFLFSRYPVWNNSYDKATIYSPQGLVQDSRSHKKK